MVMEVQTIFSSTKAFQFCINTSSLLVTKIYFTFIVSMVVVAVYKAMMVRLLHFELPILAMDIKKRLEICHLKLYLELMMNLKGEFLLEKLYELTS